MQHLLSMILRNKSATKNKNLTRHDFSWNFQIDLNFENFSFNYIMTWEAVGWSRNLFFADIRGTVWPIFMKFYDFSYSSLCW